MIELRAKLKDGTYAKETIMVDADFIKNNESIMYELYEIWNEANNSCMCSIHEGNPSCDCEGIYGSEYEVEIHEVPGNKQRPTMKDATSKCYTSAKSKEIKLRNKVIAVITISMLITFSLIAGAGVLINYLIGNGI